MSKPGRHVPSLDMLALRATRDKRHPPSPEIGKEPALSEVEWGWGEGRIMQSEDSPARKLIVPVIF